jgi:transcriptional regulator with XRE-family HTH domain
MLSAPIDTSDFVVVVTDKTFYAALGQRIAERRKTLGLTQQQLADSIGIAQQTLAHYEVGRLRVAAALLPVFSKTLGLSLNELLGETMKASKRGPTPKLQEQIERIASLPRSKQRMLLDMLDAAINSANAQAA